MVSFLSLPNGNGRHWPPPGAKKDLGLCRIGPTSHLAPPVWPGFASTGLAVRGVAWRHWVQVKKSSTPYRRLDQDQHPQHQHHNNHPNTLQNNRKNVRRLCTPADFPRGASRRRGRGRLHCPARRGYRRHPVSLPLRHRSRLQDVLSHGDRTYSPLPTGPEHRPGRGWMVRGHHRQKNVDHSGRQKLRDASPTADTYIPTT
ncbi:hypothetical protein VTJ04DRAFT_2194 [Mycothermus thermophilus]|uniref:uncharacterized protein n=1 Tax=Humicola insolens TaxID=85995 RepID=UPI003742242D